MFLMGAMYLNSCEAFSWYRYIEFVIAYVGR